jgi:hypothetical protein
MAQELESSLGGTYSVLSQEFQLPLVEVLVNRMAKSRRLPKLPKKIVKPVVVTGVEALGRGNDLNKLDMFVSGIAQSLGAQVMAQYVNVSNYLTRRATALGIDTEGLIKTSNEIEQETRLNQMREMTAKLGAPAISAMGGLAKDNPAMLQSGAENLQAQAQAALQQQQEAGGGQ